MRRRRRWGGQLGRTFRRFSIEASPYRARASRHPSSARRGIFAALIQEVSFLQPRRHVFLGNVADVLADERFDFKFEAVLDHQFDLLLPGLLVSEPRILRDLSRPLGVLLVEPDLNARTELAPLVIVAAQAEETGFRYRH